MRSTNPALIAPTTTVLPDTDSAAWQTADAVVLEVVVNPLGGRWEAAAQYLARLGMNGYAEAAGASLRRIRSLKPRGVTDPPELRAFAVSLYTAAAVDSVPVAA